MFFFLIIYARKVKNYSWNAKTNLDILFLRENTLQTA